MIKEKVCEHCGSVFEKNKRDSYKQWLARRFCSIKCNNRSGIRTRSIFDRLEKYQVKKDGCWSWIGNTDGRGYGTLSSREGRGRSPEKAHRVSYEFYFGEIPDGMIVRHKCDNPECTNPSHLEVGTKKDNARDMVERGRMNPKSLLNLKTEKKLNDEDIRYILSKKYVGINGRGVGVTRKSVAEELGVCVDLIKSVLKGEY